MYFLIYDFLLVTGIKRIHIYQNITWLIRSYQLLNRLFLLKIY